jgi:hypothetical protein
MLTIQEYVEDVKILGVLTLRYSAYSAYSAYCALVFYLVNRTGHCWILHVYQNPSEILHHGHHQG